MSRHERRSALGIAVAAAIERAPDVDFIGRLRLYCDSGACSVREVDVHVKAYEGDRPIVEARCPLCGAVLKVHAVQTLAEAEAEFRRDARASVNVELYRERERRRTGHDLVAVPLSLLLDDSLPGEGA